MSVAENAQAIAEILQGCVDGKTAIADALTSKGVSTEHDASFDTMAVNVGLIEGGASPVEKWELIGDVAVTSDDNTNVMTVSGDLLSYRKFRVIVESEAESTGAQTIFLNGMNSSSYVIGSSSVNQKFVAFDVIVYYDDLIGAVVGEGFQVGSTWGQYRPLTGTPGFISGYGKGYNHNTALIPLWNNRTSISVWKYGTTFVNARMKVLGCK